MIEAYKPFINERLDDVIPEEFGHHDVTWIRREADDRLAATPETRIGQVSELFLKGISALLKQLSQENDPNRLAILGLEPGELDEYTHGSAFYHLVPANAKESGTFHYDTGFDRPVAASNVGAAALRFAASWSSDNVPVSYVFSSDPNHYGRRVDEVAAEGSPDIQQPANNYVVAYNEGTRLHGLAPVEERPGEKTIIWSAALYKPHQVPTIIPALAELERPEVYTWRQCG